MSDYIPNRPYGPWRSASGQAVHATLPQLSGILLRTDGVHSLIATPTGLVEVHANNVRLEKQSTAPSRKQSKAGKVLKELLALV
jgi:hypothetical protein